ncbi:MAG: DUF1080 domain-containing protein [Planctomycetota bacterium]|nr:DUF1080 domain-containing protein [Planctomycetota bacterium]
MTCVRLVAAGVLVAAAALGAAIAAEEKDEGFATIFNGKDLSGWEGDAKLWIVENGMLIGRSPGIKYNDFLATTESYGDFVLRFQIRLVGDKGNTGMQFRSKRVENSHEVSGYQADFAHGWWGKLYDEARRNKVLAGPNEEDLKKVLKPDDWNDYEVRAEGNKITLTLNGLKTVEYTEADDKILRTGIIAAQIHSGGAMEVQFRNIRIRELGGAK